MTKLSNNGFKMPCRGARLYARKGMLFSKKAQELDERHQAWDQRHLVALAIAAPVVALIAAGSALLLLNVSVRPIQADVVFTMGNTQAQTDWPTHAADLYQLAIDLAPKDQAFRKSGSS